MNISIGLKALFAVQAVVPGAILAGGYLRDSILSRPAKDIDIFVPYQGPGVAPFLKLGALVMTGAAQYMEQTEVDNVFDLPGFELPVQIIELAPGLDPVDRTKDHDFGICQVWHDGTAMGSTEAFTKDCGDQTFTLVSCANKPEYDRSMRRWERLKLKFPEFTLVLPEQFLSFKDPQ